MIWLVSCGFTKLYVDKHFRYLRQKGLMLDEFSD